MEPVNILDARNNLSKLVAKAARGERVVLSKRGKAIVQIVAIDAHDHSASAAAVWLTENPAPVRSARSTNNLDTRIEEERGGWE